MVSFGSYIGTQKGKDPGASNAIRVFAQTRQQILNNVISKKSKNTQTDYEKLEKYLNDMYFGSGDNKDDSANFNRLAVAYYNEYVEKQGQRILSSAKVTDESYTLENAIKDLDALKQGTSNYKREYTSHLNTMKIRMDFIRHTLKGIKQNTKALYDKEFASLENEAKYVMKLADSLIAEVDTEEELKADMLKSVSEAKKLSSESKYRKSFYAFENLYQKLKGFSSTTPKTVNGTLFEVSLALLNQDLNKRTKVVTKKVLNEIQKAVKGGTTTNYGGRSNLGSSMVSIGIDIAQNAFTENIADSNVVVGNAIQMDFGGAKFIYNPNINTTLEGQSKIDVELQIPEMNSPVPFRVSAKNWTDLNNLSLNTTSLLRAMDRSSNNSNNFLENYAFVMQHPLGERKTGTLAVQYAHNLAKICAIADIAVGLGQEEGYADTLIVLDKTGQKVHIVNLIDTLEKMMKNTFQSENFTGGFSVKGYNESAIRDTGISIRENIMSRVIKENARSAKYLSIMYSYLNSIIIDVHINKELLTSSKIYS